MRTCRSHDRILPDLFREGQAVVATGRMQAGTFVAEDVLAKHDETYMPREVADKMQSAHRRHAVPAAADTATEAGTGMAGSDWMPAPPCC
jgi:cytochrome c-type biogenesis protein CcmE